MHKFYFKDETYLDYIFERKNEIAIFKKNLLESAFLDSVVTKQDYLF